MQLVRLDGWQGRLGAVANERRSMPYRYGTTDCWCFARAAVEAVTGTTLLPDVEPPKGWLAAAKVMITRGWESVEDLMTETLGPPIDPKSSQPGDILSYEDVGELHLAVRVGDVALAPVDIGLKVIPPEKWRRGWKVG